MNSAELRDLLTEASFGKQIAEDEVHELAKELFERPAFKQALDEVSEVRLKKLLYAEFPDLKPYIEKMAGEKTLQRRATLAEIWQVDEAQAGALADRLVAVGFFNRSGEKSDPDYQVPFLYRPALSLVRGSAKLPDEE